MLLILLSIQITSAQETLSVNETVFIHSNATTFVTGETILFKIYCLKESDKTPSLISKIAYVEIVDDHKKSVYKTKIALENAVGQGDYFIPTTLKTGNYKLIGYTNWTLNRPVSELFQIDLNIINPYKVSEENITENKLKTNDINSPTLTLNENAEKGQSNSQLQLKLNKKTFTNRELVDLKIESPDRNYENGNYSLSIRKVDQLPSKNQISSVAFYQKQPEIKTLNIQNQEKTIVLPEIRGEMISGKITAKNNSDRVENIGISLSIPGKSFAFEVVKTDSNGNFVFSVNKSYYTAEVIVQIIDEKASNYDLKINNSPELDYTKLSSEPNVTLSYAIKENLLERSISNQIENAYYHKKTDVLTKGSTQEPFYYPLAKEYILDDFTRFKTLKETITEVATEIYSKQNNDKLYLHVNDPSIFPQLQESALVLVDGQYLENQNDLNNYNMKNIYKIEVIVGRYYIGPKSFNGLVSFTTFNKDFKSTQTGSFIAKPNTIRPKPKKIYNKVDYLNPEDLAKIPDFRYQLFWNPDVKINQDSNNTFYTSDLNGLFEIKLEGFTKDGQPTSIKQTIEVIDTRVN